MRAARALLLFSFIVFLPGDLASARSSAHRQVLLFVIDGLSYPDALADPVMGALARAGGVGLMTNAGATGAAAHAAIGSGATIAERFPETTLTPVGDGAVVVTSLPSDPPGVRLGALGSALSERGLVAGYVTRCCELGAPSRRRGMFAAMDDEGRIPVGFVADHRGNFGLHGLPEVFRDRFEHADLVVVDLGMWSRRLRGLALNARRQVRTWLRETTANEVMAIVAVPSPGEDMVARTGTLTPLIAASGSPHQLLSGQGQPGSITSATTRQGGVVSNVDVAPSILGFLQVPVPETMRGSPMRVEGDAPTLLYERAIDYQRVGAPVRVAVLVLEVAALAVGILLLFLRGRRGLKVALALAGLFAVAAMVALVPASVLPSLELPILLPALAVIAGVLLGGAMVAGRRDHAAAVAVVAVAGLLLLAIDGLLGWPTEVTPLLGGGALLGVRFFGLGNSGAGILMAGAVLGAVWLRPWAGTALLAGAALFAGLPMVGADLGGGITLFAVAALWARWTLRGRFDGWSLATAVVVSILAAGLLVAVHAIWPAETHVSRAVDAASGPGGLVGTALERLGDNVRTTTEVWPAWIAVLGLPVWLLLAWRPAGPFRAVLDRRPWWRGPVMILASGGMIGYVVNDTYGMAAAAFGFVSTAMVYPALREGWSRG